MFRSWNQAFRIMNFLGRSSNTNAAWCWKHSEERFIWSYYVFPITRCPGYMIITPSFPPFSVVLSRQRFRNCSSTVDVGFVKLSLDYLWGNRVFKMVIEFCFAAVVLRFWDKILSKVRRSPSLTFGPLFLSADDVFPWFVYAVTTLETAVLDTPHEMAGRFGYRRSS